MKNEFDDILKKRWEEIRFPVDDRHRQEMIHLLDQPKRRKGVFFWWLGGFVVTVSVGIMILRPSQENDILNSGTPATNLSTIEVKTEQSNTNAHSDDDGVIEKVNTQNSMNRQVGSGSEVQLMQNHIETKEKINATSNNKKISVSTTKKLIIASGSTHIPNVPEKIIRTEPDFVHIENALPNPTTLDDQTKSGNTDINPSLQLRNDFITIPIEPVLISEIDFSHEIILLPVAPGFKKTNPFNLFGEGGISYIPASFPDIKSGWSLRAGGGMNYTIFSKTQFIWTAGYMLQKDGFSFERSSTVNQPGFGVRSNFHTLTADKLHFVYSKLGIQHHLRRHILSAFAGVQWLYGAQGTVVIQTQQQLPSISSESTEYAWINLNGMQRLLWSGEINYGYQVSPRISLHLGIRHYFTSLKAEDSDLADEGYYWKGRFASINPSFTINYRLYGK